MYRKRKAVLKNFRDHVVKTTAFMDADTEYYLLALFRDSVKEDANRAGEHDDVERVNFLDSLWYALKLDMEQVAMELGEIDKMWVIIERREEGTYGVRKHRVGGGLEVENYLEGEDPWSNSNPYLEDETTGKHHRTTSGLLHQTSRMKMERNHYMRPEYHGRNTYLA